jgi:hypothetical protein
VGPITAERVSEGPGRPVAEYGTRKLNIELAIARTRRFEKANRGGVKHQGSLPSTM